MENETIRILFENQKEQILADFRAEIQKHEFQADSEPSDQCISFLLSTTHQ